MEKTLIVRGRYAAKSFIPDDPMPDTEGTAELIITRVTQRVPGSIADAFGKAQVLRSGEDILAQIRADREEWGDR